MNKRKTPQRQFSRACPSREEIKSLLRELKRRRISRQARSLFVQRASQEPIFRLSSNLHIMLNQIYNHHVDDVLCDGLQDHERHALIELDSSNLPVPLREVAHGLLNVHERWVMLKSLSKMYRQARESRGASVEEHLLDDVLGGEEV